MASLHSFPVMHLLGQNESWGSVFRNEIGQWFKVVIGECACVRSVWVFFNVRVQIDMLVLSAADEEQRFETLRGMDHRGILLVYHGSCLCSQLIFYIPWITY